jgi:hypothetical protein
MNYLSGFDSSLFVSVLAQFDDGENQLGSNIRARMNR